MWTGAANVALEELGVYSATRWPSATRRARPPGALDAKSTESVYSPGGTSAAPATLPSGCRLAATRVTTGAAVVVGWRAAGTRSATAAGIAAGGRVVVVPSGRGASA